MDCIYQINTCFIAARPK